MGEGSIRSCRPAPLGGTTQRRSRRSRPQAADARASDFRGRLRSSRQFHQHPQRFDDRTLPHRAAADRTETAFAMDQAAVARGDREMHEAHRLARRRAAGPGDAGDGDREIGAGAFQRADRHRGRGFLADRAETVAACWP